MRRFILYSSTLLAIALISFFAFQFKDAIVFRASRLIDENIEEEETMLLAMLDSHPKEIFSSYQTYLRAHPTRTKYCHGILHRIGHVAVETMGWDKAMAIANPLCGGGFIHGMIETRFGLLSVLSPKSVQTEVLATCGSPKNEICYHGIGHGLMVLFNNDDLAALQACQEVSLPGRMDCFDGIFMHIFDAEETGVPKDSPRRAEGALFCKSLTHEQRVSCYFYLPRIFANTPMMVENAVHVCSSVTPLLHQNICIQGSGHMFLKYMLPDTETAMEACQSFPTAQQKICEAGADDYKKLQESTSGPL